MADDRELVVAFSLGVKVVAEVYNLSGDMGDVYEKAFLRLAEQIAQTRPRVPRSFSPPPPESSSTDEPAETFEAGEFEALLRKGVPLEAEIEALRKSQDIAQRIMTSFGF